jgi:hypothetical protein
MEVSKKELLDLLKAKAKGLLTMSESDYPLKPFVWERAKVGAETMTAQTLTAYRKIPEVKPIAEVDFAAFFAPATKDESWHGPEEKASAEGFRQLVAALQANLTELKVYKVGDAKKDVYIIGKTAEGDFGGVTTKVVET